MEKFGKFQILPIFGKQYCKSNITTMKLSLAALEAIQGDTQIKNALAIEFKCSVYSIARWLKTNEDNGELTKKAALVIIEKGTGLTEDQILEEELSTVGGGEQS